MAKILPGIAVNKISGTINGTTFQNWRGILVARSKPTPTNVNTPRQAFVRSLLSSLSKAWRDVLNQGQRTAWNQRASNYSWFDVFGNAVFMTGENLYIKQNFVLLDHARPRVDTPVADVSPSEVNDIKLELEGVGESAKLIYPGLDAGEIASQSPFLDIVVARSASVRGGAWAVDDTLTLDCPGLPLGRTHQKSDMRHSVYLDDLEPAVAPLLNPTIAFSTGSPDMPKKIAVSIRRFNKYGNFSAPIMLVSESYSG